MKTFRVFRAQLLLLALLLTVAACKKDKESEPSKTDLLTGTTWKDSQETLQLNNVSGTQTIDADEVETYQFARDGKLTTTSASGTATNGKWSFAGNETQLTITNGNTTATFEIFELSKTRFSYGLRYNQAQIQQALGGGGGTNGQLLTLLLLSAGNFTFPAGTPTIPAAQLTSVQWMTNTVPR